ncbi:MAG: bifunctional 5,10-methylenetetrahydrofolate dehydrogenase/5,10-methenyltetrahydrofolate cyclohydrolase [bacterium]|nr:bifunctional 5,10-methylenetetrahydrofolate dehydrogenase/5,10-methenyltetrahydrofolate cyclohydrolase [bacterium]
MAKIIDGVIIANKINTQTGKLVKTLSKRGQSVKLAVVLIGDNQASLKYVERKAAMAKTLGIEFILKKFPLNITPGRLAQELKNFQAAVKPSGLIIQLPLPERLYCPEVLNAIDTDRDVDFLNEASQGKIMFGSYDIEPPTPGAIMTILRELKINLSGKNITIVGMGALVGRPLVMLLDGAGSSITTCNSKTKDLPGKCRSADILISGVGKKDLIRGNMIKPGAVVIDAGFSYEAGKSFGDVHLVEALAVAGFVTPTPGGVGPITVALLLSNTVKRAMR